MPCLELAERLVTSVPDYLGSGQAIGADETEPLRSIGTATTGVSLVGLLALRLAVGVWPWLSWPPPLSCSTGSGR